MRLALLAAPGTAVRTAVLAAALMGAALATIVAPQVARADAPQICDSLPHEMTGGIDLSGRWGNEGETVVFTHVGSSVTAVVSYDEGGSGTYEGCFDGAARILYMQYQNTVDDGYAQMALPADGRTLSGYWYSYEDDSGRHSWTLTRAD